MVVKQLSTKTIVLITFLGRPNNPNTIPTYIQESSVTYDEAFRDLTAEPADPMRLGPDVVDGKLAGLLSHFATARFKFKMETHFRAVIINTAVNNNIQKY